ncbi:MAG: TrbC family F-type conjugative pilus assembly protein [Aliarcobacter sp.]|nr:TrbC family F-type conjugative pilus assembly protein [Aliarcobacter sp.]
MLYNKLLLVGLLSTSFLLADKFDIVKELENNAFIKAQDINLEPIQKNIDKEKFNDSISEIYKSALKNVDIESRRIHGEKVELKNFTMENGLKIQKEINLKDFILNNRIYIFMSESVPFDIWHTYGKLIHNKKLINTSMVLRGCIGGNCSKIAPTAEFVLKIKQYDKNNEINPNIIIDPLLFRKYNITQAPCVVFAQNTQTKDLTISEGNDKNFNAQEIFKSCGDWSFIWHLKEIQKKANSTQLEQIINYLEPKGSL